MNDVRIETPKSEGGGPVACCGTRIWIDGKEEKLVSEARIVIDPRGALQLTLTKYLSHLEIQGQAEIERIVVCPSCGGRQ